MENTTIKKKLFEFQKKIEPIKKDATNPHFKNKYATLTNVLSEVKPILSELGLVITQPIIDGSVHSVITDVESGQSESSSLAIPLGLQPQSVGSAITYFRRYTLCSLLSLEIEDDDGNGTQTTPTTPAQPDDNRPWLNDKAVQQAVERIRNGEAGVVEKCKAAFKISKANLAKLNEAINAKS